MTSALGVAAEPEAKVQGNMDRTLKQDIQRAITTSKTHPVTRLEARRRAREAGEAAIAVLRSEGYYDYVVEPQVGEGDTPDAIVQITPGPRTTFAPAKLVWDGPAPDPQTAGAAEAALAITPGAPARAPEVLAAEGRAAAVARQRGYADAGIRPRQVVVDHATHKLQTTVHLAAGDLVRLDGLNVVTEGRTNPAWVAKLAPWKSGDRYDPHKVAELERRLRDVGVYNSVTVDLAPPDKAVGGLRPVIVSLGDRPPRTVELGVGYSTSEGAGVDGKLIYYNRLRRADTLTFTARVAQIQQKLDAELDLPDWRRPDQILKLGGGFYGDRTDAYDDMGVGLRTDVERHWTKTTYITLGGALDAVETKEKTTLNSIGLLVGERLRLFIISGLAGFALDRSNDPLNPTRGWRLDVRLEPTYLTGDRTLPYLKAQAQASGYLPLGRDEATVLAGRVKLGSIIGGDLPTVPADRRFFAGGGGSVRGFGYQKVGPRLADGTPIGGLSLVETSFEVRRKLSGPWGIAAFVDAGALGESAALNFSRLSIGAGVGVRYDLGFGPIRVDIATPLNRQPGDPVVELYFSIGQSF
jgi:translocation and assembly module TamA